MDDEGDGFCFPYDVLLDILCRLPGGAIAPCKCVCRAWRAIIDSHNLSLERYFPRRAFPGIFVTKVGCHSDSTFFSPSGHRRLYYPRKTTVKQSCNGLLLIEDWGGYCVLNPATSRHALLPRPTPWRLELMSLAFDPAVSLHYGVFLFQKHILVEESAAARPTEDQVPPLDQVQEEVAKEPKEKVVPLLVYSSCTGQWENRAFTPGCCAPGHLYDVVARPSGDYEGAFWSCEYWRGSLYVHCQNNVLMIFRPSKGTYDMVALPEDNWLGPKSHLSLPRNSILANYERGIHYVAIDGLQLRVWLLTESTNGQLGWTLAYDANLNQHGHMIHPLTIQPKVTWGIVRSNSGPVSLTEDDESDDEEEEEEDLDGSEYSWNSDEDNFIDKDVGEATHLGPPAWGSYSRIVGFHPHKNAIILVLYFAVVMYHLDTSRMQYLGDENELTKDHEQQACFVDDAFTYRPCYEDVLPVGKSSSPNK